MKLLSKVAAVLAGAATLVAVGAAVSASAADLPLIYADQIYAEPGQVVDFSVLIDNNTGYAGSGIRLIYDENVEPQGVNGLSIPKVTGPGSSGLSGTVACNTSKLRCGWTSSGTEDCTGNGVIYTVQFKVPDNAAPGTTYPMQVVVTQFCNAKNEDIEYTTADGWIKIKEAETTPAPATETTPAPATETTPAPATETTPAPGTETTPAPGTETTPAPGSEEPGTGDTTAAPGGETTTTTTTTTSGGNEQPPKTGDAGVALAIAGLLTAAGAAIVIRKKH